MKERKKGAWKVGEKKEELRISYKKSAARFDVSCAMVHWYKKKLTFLNSGFRGVPVEVILAPKKVNF